MIRSNRHLLRAILIATVVVASLAAVTALAISADDDIPGVLLPASPVMGSLTDTAVASAWDYDDVYRVPLAFNEKFVATMVPPKTADYDLYLFSYSTKTLDQAFASGAAYVSALSERATGETETLTYVSNRSTPATWYLDVAAMYDSSGPYTLTWTKTQLPTPSLEITMPATTATYGGAATIVGTATVDGRPMSGFTIEIFGLAKGSTSYGSAKATVKTSEAGTFTAVVRPTITTRYHARSRWANNADDSGATGWGFSTPATITPAPYLSFTSTPRYAYAGKAFTISGVLKPSHSSGSTRHVKVYAQKYDGTRYVTYKYYYMANKGTTWSGRFALPKGRWRLSLACTADSLHTAGRGTTFRYFNVK